VIWRFGDLVIEDLKSPSMTKLVGNTATVRLATKQKKLPNFFNHKIAKSPNR
jgi:hypothetical protein